MRDRKRRYGGVVGLAVMALALAACDDAPEAAAPEPRPVRVVTVGAQTAGETLTLSGLIEAETEADLAFRIGGRMIERLVNVGDVVAPGQLVARLDSQDEENALRGARAALTAAEGQLVEARSNFERQKTLLERGFTTRQRYDEALQTLQTLEASADSAKAQLEIARNRVADTALRADASGVVTARGAEPGEVVQPGRMIARIARDDGRDAVFDVPANVIQSAPRNPQVRVALSIDPGVTADGRVREIAPRADPVTGTFRVKVGLEQPPAAMRLGATVTGTVTLDAGAGVVIPASALTRDQGAPAVWVVDPASATVSLRPVEVARFGPAEVSVARGLEVGDVVVTAGVQAILPGQKVRLLGDPS